jgi:TDG/mug DNA glycosylase family protein
MATAQRYRPACVAILGISAYRTAFDRPKAEMGPQPEAIGPSALWVLPNPSGLNAHYQLPALTALFRELRETLGT